MVSSGCAVLQRVAEEIQQQGWSEAKMSSIQRRLERFVANKEVVVTDIWQAFLAQVLPSWKEQKLTFVLDCMPYNAQFTIVYLGLLVHSRVLPEDARDSRWCGSASSVTGITCCVSVRSTPVADRWASPPSGVRGVPSRALSARKVSSGTGVRSSGKRRASKRM